MNHIAQPTGMDQPGEAFDNAKRLADTLEHQTQMSTQQALCQLAFALIMRTNYPGLANRIAPAADAEQRSFILKALKIETAYFRCLV